MGSAMFAAYYAQTTGVPPRGSQPEDPHVRAVADVFYISQGGQDARLKGTRCICICGATR
eukprot:6945008-Pyramimonas_sp.AAC.1